MMVHYTAEATATGGREGHGLGVDPAVRLPGMSRADAKALAARVHEVCPYSNATRGNTPVTITVEDTNA